MGTYIETYRAVVYPWHCDHQGHMTTMHYVGMFDAAFWHLLSAAGFSRDYLEANGTGFVDVQDTIRYRAEQAVGALVHIESGITKVGNTSVTGYHRMLNSESGEVAATSEKITVYFDLKARRKVPFPEDLRARLEAMLVEVEE
jgi:acyl-CoA thioester hydrolase